MRIIIIIIIIITKIITNQQTTKQLLVTNPRADLLHYLRQIKNVLVNPSQCVYLDLLSPILIKTFVK